jgi:hypothetical protein
MQLPPYFQQVRDALLRSGHTPADAYRLTWGAIRRWAHGGGKAHPEVVAAAQAALAALAAKSAIAHAHANGGGMTINLAVYQPPHVPAGAPNGGQFGTTSGGAAAPAKGPSKGAMQAQALHAQAAKLRAQARAIQAQIAGINKLITAQVKSAAAAKKKPGASATAKAKAAIAKAAPKKAAAAAPKKATAKKRTLSQNRAAVKTLTARVHSLLSQASALDAQAKAVKLSSGGDAGFLDLAMADAIAVDPAARRLVTPAAERVPPGRPEGGQYASPPPALGRYDTPQRAASVINGMGPRQRAAMRASTLPPPGFQWGPNDRLGAAGVTAGPKAPAARTAPELAHPPTGAVDLAQLRDARGRFMKGPGHAAPLKDRVAASRSPHAQGMAHTARAVAAERAERVRDIARLTAQVRAASQHHSEMQDKQEARKSRVKFAVHVGALAAGAILAAVEVKMGTPGLTSIASALGPTVMMELADMKGKL